MFECQAIGWQSRPELVDTGDSAESLVRELRGLWCEDVSPIHHYVIRNGKGGVVAVLVRDAVDEEICHTLWSDGRVEHHKCHYVEGVGGSLLRVEVTELPTQPCHVCHAVPAGWDHV
jgi:hypothetical protein